MARGSTMVEFKNFYGDKLDSIMQMTAVRFVKSKDTRGIDEGECDPRPTA